MPITITQEEKQILQNVLIPPQPKVLLSVVSEAREEEPEIPLIIKAISEDMGIASAVLQIVNSAAYRRAVPIESIEQAVLVLGIRRIVTVVKSVALRTSMSHSKRLATFWERASEIANASAIMAELLDRANLVDHAYMLGLFHEAGVPLMFQSFKEYDAMLIEAQSHSWLGLHLLEREKLPISHNVVGAMLAQKWKLPRVLMEVIYYVHDVEGIFHSGELSELGLEFLSIIKMARQAVATKHGCMVDNSEWHEITDQLQDFWHLSEIELENLMVTCQERLDVEFMAL